MVIFSLVFYLPFCGCTEKKPAVSRDIQYEKVKPASWKALKSIRDSCAPVPDLDSLYQDRRHPNGLPYHLYVPALLTKGKEYPLVVFLHGHTDLSLRAHGGFPKGVWALPQVQKTYPHVLFVPRHRTNDDNWTDDGYRSMVMKALDDVIRELNAGADSPHVDTNRVYLTGFSQGGMGVWDFVLHYPRKFAAAVPLSGYFQGPQDEKAAGVIKDVPIWIFSGSKDDGVEGSRRSYQALKRAGAPDVRYHEFVGHGHVIDDFAYFTEGFLDWMFAQVNKPPEPEPR